MQLKLILEALLHTSQKPLSPAELRDVLLRAADEDGADENVRALRNTRPEDIETSLKELAAEHDSAGRSYRLACVAGSWQFVTHPDFAPWLKAFLGVKSRPSRLSQPALETLAIVAYRQPITRAEIEQIRGVAVDGVLATLRERNLIAEAGRAEVIGRPMQYATTHAFLEYFGLAGLEGLPAAEELRLIPVQRPQSLLTVDTELATVPSVTAQAELPIEAVDPSVEGGERSDAAPSQAQAPERAPGQDAVQPM